jgi:hypothetical protein
VNTLVSALSVSGEWPWLAIAGLGAFHGINPAMGWLFAVALGLYRQSRRTVWLALVPIALGHAMAVAVALAGAAALGLVVAHTYAGMVCGAVLLLWALWRIVRGHRARPRVGMQTGLAGLAVWSFLMAGAHGAGLMLIPVLMPLCAGSVGGASLTGAWPIGAAALLVHTAAMLGTIAVVSIVVYERVGVAFLRAGWINFDWLWSAALGTCGIVLLAS